MTASKPATPTRGAKPEWSNLPRRKCDNCGKSYKPFRPLRDDQKYGFHSDACKKQFHKHGGAYRQLRDAMERMVSSRLEELTVAVKELAARILALESADAGETGDTGSNFTPKAITPKFRRARLR